MKKYRFSLYLFSLLIITLNLSSALATEDPTLSKSLEEHKRELEETQQGSLTVKEKALKLKDQETLVQLENVEEFLEAKSKCFHEKEEMGIRLCILQANKSIAESGNFVAQYSLGTIYEHLENKTLALKWLKVALENPKTSMTYKYEILDEIEKLEKIVTKQETTAPALSPEMQKLLKEIKEVEKTLPQEKRKAELLKNKDQVVIWQHFEKYLNVQGACFSKMEEIEVRICVDKELKHEAERGNFIAQHQVGNIYENSYENKKMAKKWYETALKNPKTPSSYKIEIENDLARLEGTPKNDQDETLKKP